jgi:hemoglobin/transferrin/lactoferrin receptor protein
MKRFYFMAIAVCTLLSPAAMAQTNQTITVRDRATLIPVSNAAVEIHSLASEGINNARIWQNTGVTDAKGQITITIPASADSVRFTHPAFGTQGTTVAAISASNGTMLLTQRVLLLNEFVYAANRSEERKADVPYQIGVVSSRDVELGNPQNSGDMLMNTGQVFVQKSQMGGSSPVLRGFEASRVLIVVDGVRMNNLIYRAGHLQDVITIDPNMLERTEVVFGPSSVIYGSDAMGGTMHFITKKPVLGTDSGLFTSGNAFVRYSSANNEQSAHVDFNLGTKRFASLTSITRSDFGDLRMGANGNPYDPQFGWCKYYVERIDGKDSVIQNTDPLVQKFTGYTQIDVTQKFLFKQNDNVSHLLNLQLSTSSDIPRYDRLQQLSNGLPRFAEWYYGPQNRVLAAYTMQLSNGKSFYDNAGITLSTQRLDQDRITRRRNNVNRVHQSEDVSMFALNADFKKQIGKKNELRYGAEFMYNTVASTATSTNIETLAETPAATRYSDGDNAQLMASLYASNSWEISEKFIVSGGVRLGIINLSAQWNDTTFFPFPYKEVKQNNFAPGGNLGFVWMPSQKLRINVLGSTAFRAPNIDDLSKVFDSQPGTLVVPNPELKPEFALNGEFGISWTFTEGVRIDFAGWYTAVTNAIAVRDFTFNGSDSIVFDGTPSRVVASQNSDRGYITGFSSGITADFNDHFSFRGTVTYTYGRYIDTENDTVVPLDHIPPVFGQSGLVYHTNKLECELFARYNGWKHLADYSASGEDNLPQATAFGTPAWTTLNIRAGIQLNRWVRVTGAVENIFDLNYRHFASGMSAPGRNLIIAARVRF